MAVMTTAPGPEPKQLIDSITEEGSRDTLFGDDGEDEEDPEKKKKKKKRSLPGYALYSMRCTDLSHLAFETKYFTARCVKSNLAIFD